MAAGVEGLLTKMVARYSELMIIGSLVLFGASTNATIALQNARAQGLPYGFVDFLIAMFIAAFSGVVFALTGEIFGLSGKSLYACASIGAFMGLSGLNQVVDLFLDVLAKRIKR